MAVYKDEERGTWYVHLEFKDIHGKRIQRRRRGFARKKDAVIAEREIIKKLQQPNTDLTFEELAILYMEYSVGRKKARSINNQNNLIETLLLPYLGDKTAKKITPTDIDNFYRSILPKYTNSSMKNIRTTLSAIFNYGVSFFDLPKNVVNIVQLPKKHEEKRLKYWTLEQFNEFENVVDNIVYKTMFSVLFWTGLRKGEMLALRVCDIDLKNNAIDVVNSWTGYEISSVKSTASERRIAIPNQISESISELIEYHKKQRNLRKTDYLFTVRNPTTPMTPSNVNLQLKKYTKIAGLPEIRVHYFRHSHASLLINKGVSLYIVSKHLGHEDIQTTANIYGHLYPNSEKEVADLLETTYENRLNTK
ncbi:tyrosine-type recombinase/integrase [Staphylococcus sp. LKG3-3]|uniref:site-specific integrase n=1 Tax=Staphylococcus sp. LKG3-3 TaxID=3399685 RepID=UPI003D598442